MIAVKAFRLMLQPFRKYFDFVGRARRAEFWLFALFYVVTSSALVATSPSIWLVAKFGLELLMEISPADLEALYPIAFGYYAKIHNGVFSIFWFGTLVPLFAVTVRRLHDRNVSGWWLLWFLLIAFFMSMGAVFYTVVAWQSGVLTNTNSLAALLILGAATLAFLTVLCMRGKSGPNKFGEDPLKAASG